MQPTKAAGQVTPALRDDLVTVVIPARNEERFIGPCLDAVLAQDEPRLQVVVVDGDSEDRTAEIVRRRAVEDPRVELVENPARIIPVALNLALAAARGRYLVRIDAHATVPDDYVRRAVEHLRTGRWGGVGGRKDGVGVTPAGAAVAAAMASPFGVGGSTYHHGTEVQPVEHIPFGAYPTALARELGGWDERLAVNQDFEFDVRVRAAGHQLLFDPGLVILWHCRQSIGDLFRQYKRYGRGKVRVARLHPRSLRVRHLMAPALVASFALIGAFSVVRPRRALAALTPYLAALGVAGATTARRVDPPARPYVPAAFAAMHIGWGIGFWHGVVDAVVGRSRRQPSSSGRKPRVVVIAQAAPAQGGIASFAKSIVDDPSLGGDFDLELLNTTRQAVRVGGAPTAGNARNAIVDAARAYGASRRADVVHLQTALVPALPLLRALAICGAARLGGATVLCHVHSGRINSGRAEAFTPGPAMRVLLRGLRVADGLLTCADLGTATLRRVVPGVPVETVNNAVDVASFVPSSGGASAPVRLLFLGTISRRKGVLDLVTAIRLLQERGVGGWELDVVGGAAEVGEEEAGSLREAFVAAGLGSSLLGPLHGPALNSRLTAADVFVLPSHWEGQPIAMLEAMATGLPIVATRVGAIPDVVGHEVEGLLVEPHEPEALADVLERLITDGELRQRLGAAARRRVEAEHDTVHLSRRLSDIYRRAVSV